METNLNERIEALEKYFKKELSEIKKDVKTQAANHSKWVPKDGEIVFAVHGDGDVQKSSYERYLLDYLKHGRMFQTKEEAEFFSEKELVRAELEALADDDGEWNGENGHWYIEMDYTAGLSADCRYVSRFDIPYFKSEESVLNAIKTVGEERIKKYLFGVNNENQN